MKLRASIGTANALGLRDGRNAVEPTTAYLLLERGCTGKCVFCPQAQGRRSELSRVEWPEFEADEVAARVHEAKFERVCVQTSLYPKLQQDLAEILALLGTKKPVSVAISAASEVPPLGLARAGVDRIGVPTDGASMEVMERAKGTGEGGWDAHFGYMTDALEAFGKERVSTHLIVGLGETERELASSIRSFTSIGVRVALFALTPFKGSGLKAPPLRDYRRAQMTAWLLADLDQPLDTLEFDGKGRLARVRLPRREVLRELMTGKAFRTRGCPGCNRPFYNESVNGPWYNFPRTPSREEAAEAAREAVEGLEFDG